ncbi:MAG TPA: hypothetical protein VGB24_00485 [Longimicrobium sp.]|jgi:hypothetical protein|uniref:hypothetical protein n=1 Tax=Longimicrobium sp. TaxID=2029185 RepID=UPI002EDB33B5
MTIPDRFKKGLFGLVAVAGGLMFGSAASAAMGAAAAHKTSPPRVTAEEHSAAAYDRATVRFTGRLAPTAVAAASGLPSETTVLVAMRGADLATCEDMGRQLRELYRAVPDEPGWGMAILIDSAGQDDLRRFLAKERIPRVAIVVADPTRLMADGTPVATPAALVTDRQGHIQAGVSHPSRFKNLRGRSFAQELPLDSPGSR